MVSRTTTLIVTVALLSLAVLSFAPAASAWEPPQPCPGIKSCEPPCVIGYDYDCVIQIVCVRDCDGDPTY